MQQQPVIHIIGVGEVGIRVINQLIRYEPHYITTGIAIAAEADTLHDAQIPIRILVADTNNAPHVTAYLHETKMVLLVVDYGEIQDMQLAHQTIASIGQRGIPVIALVTNSNTMQSTPTHRVAFQQLQHAATGVFMLDHQQPERIISRSKGYTPPQAITHARNILSDLLRLFHDPGLISIDPTDFAALFHESAKVGIIKTYCAQGRDANQQITAALHQSQIATHQYPRILLHVHCGEAVTLPDIGAIADEVERICGPDGNITWGLFVDVNCPEDYLQVDLFAVESV